MSEIEIKDITRLRLTRNDILIVRIVNLEHETGDRIKATLNDVFKKAGYDFEPQIIISDSDVTMEVVEA